MLLPLLRSPTAISTVIHGFGLGLRLLFMMALVRLGSPALLGFYGLLTAIDVIVVYATGFELHTFTTRRYSRHATPSQLLICFGAHVRAFLFAAPLAATVAVVSAWTFDVALDTTGFICFALVSATGVIAQDAGRYLVIVGKPIRAIMIPFLRTAAWIPLAIPLLWREGHSLRYITIVWAAASAVAAAWGMHAMRAALSRHLHMRWRYVRSALTRSFGYYAVATAQAVQSNVERFVLQVMLGPAAVGIYSLFATLASALGALIQAGVLNIFLPRLLTAFATLAANRHAVLAEAMRRALWVCIIMSVMILIGAVPIVHLTAHAEYLRFVWILPALLVGQTILMWTQPVHLALFGAHHDRALFAITLSFLAISVGASAAFIGIAGILGAAVSPVIVSLSLAYTRWRVYRAFQAKGTA